MTEISDAELIRLSREAELDEIHLLTRGVRQLMAERDEAQRLAADRSQWIANCVKAQAERDAARAEVDRRKRVAALAEEMVRGISWRVCEMEVLRDPAVKGTARDLLNEMATLGTRLSAALAGEDRA